MNNEVLIKRRIISELSDRGFRNSSSRNVVITAFAESNKHLNIEELHKIVKRIKPKIGFATVYRTLKLLVENGFAREVDFKDGFTRYELQKKSPDQHYHMICIKCKNVIEFDDKGIEQIKQTVCIKTGFKPLYYRLEIFGVCKKCSKKRG
ncbi:MAG: transcriptional repressor [Deltaproteobacteria bacterium]|nr:transcriptional repressor [Deltaproteobacteria bacterium]MCL5792101.1 transcriptional repressor [Deltaproteobacteria bacterium]